MTGHSVDEHSSAAAISERPYEAAAEVERVVAGFTDGTLPHAEWTHRAHLTVALWYATHHEAAEALDLVRAGILRLNAAHGVPTTPTRGYHETITRFYMRVVRHFVEQEAGEGRLGRACESSPETVRSPRAAAAPLFGGGAQVARGAGGVGGAGSAAVAVRRTERRKDGMTERAKRT